jgi:hypothetical protein
VPQPRFLVVLVVLAVFVGATMVGVAYQYPLGLALVCGLLAAGFAVVLNLPPEAPYLYRLLLILPLSVGVGVLTTQARDRELSVAAPFLALAMTVAVHLVVLRGVRRQGQSGTKD